LAPPSIVPAPSFFETHFLGLLDRGKNQPLDFHVEYSPERSLRVKDGITHLDPSGRPRMVDVGSKEPTKRVAVASGLVRMTKETLAAIIQRRTAKGDVLQVAQLAAIQAAKRTWELIPLCHPVALTKVEASVEPD
jgi:hypothetical protein